MHCINENFNIENTTIHRISKKQICVKKKNINIKYNFTNEHAIHITTHFFFISINSYVYDEINVNNTVLNIPYPNKFT